MGLPTTYKGLITKDEGELYDVETDNNNLAQIDAGLATITTVMSTYNTANFDATQSRFSRLVVGNQGIVTATIVVNMKTAQSLPINTASNLLLITDLIPAGFRGSSTLGNYSGVLSGVGRGDAVHYAIASGRNLTMRSAGAAFTTTAGVTIYANHVWTWDGVY